MDRLKVSLKYLFFLLAAGFIAVSCIKEEIDLDKISDKMYWNPKLGIPVAYSTLSLEDLIESIDSEQMIKSDSTKFLTLVYSNRILSNTAATIMKFDDQQFGEAIFASQLGIPAAPTQNPIVFTKPNSYPFTMSHGEIIDSLVIKTGTLSFNISSTYKHQGKLIIEIPQLKKNNKAFKDSVSITKSDGTFSTVTNFNVAGYKLVLEHPNVTDNKMSFNYTVKLINSGAGVTAGDRIGITIDFTNIAFSSLFGYLGNRQLINTLSEFSFPIFGEVSQPSLRFANPSIKIRSRSSFGLPANIELYNVEAINSKDNKTIPLTFSTGTNPFNIKSPQTIGGYANDSVIFNKNTTNLFTALEIGPNKIKYGIRSFANPAGKTLNYVTDSSKLAVDLDVELPLDLGCSKVEFKDTMDLDLSDVEDLEDKVKSLLLRTSFENGMPIDMNLQVYFLTETYQHVDTLFAAGSDNTINSGELNQAGKVIKPTRKILDSQFSKTEIEKLKTVRNAIVKASIATTGGGTTYVKFYSNYTLKVTFGVQTELEIKE